MTTRFQQNRQAQGPPSTKLFICGRNLTKDSVRPQLDKYGRNELHVVNSGSQYFTYAFVYYGTLCEAQAAIEGLHMKPPLDLIVRYAINKERPGAKRPETPAPQRYPPADKSREFPNAQIFNRERFAINGVDSSREKSEMEYKPDYFSVVHRSKLIKFHPFGLIRSKCSLNKCSRFAQLCCPRCVAWYCCSSCFSEDESSHNSLCQPRAYVLRPDNTWSFEKIPNTKQFQSNSKPLDILDSRDDSCVTSDSTSQRNGTSCDEQHVEVDQKNVRIEPDPLELLNEFTECVLVYGEGEGICWVQTSEAAAKLSKLSEQLRDNENVAVTDPVEGIVYSVLFDDIWCRARITEVDPLTVVYIDYGNSEIVDLTDLHPLPAAGDVPPLALKVKLAAETPQEYLNLGLNEMITLKATHKLPDGTAVCQVQGVNAAEIPEVYPISNDAERVMEMDGTAVCQVQGVNAAEIPEVYSISNDAERVMEMDGTAVCQVQGVNAAEIPEVYPISNDTVLVMEIPQRKDYYEILKIDKTASTENIRKAFRKLALVYHPDRLMSASGGEKIEQGDQFKKLAEAYSVLCDPKKREQYDNGQNNEVISLE